jgi:hypothetical protein
MNVVPLLIIFGVAFLAGLMALCYFAPLGYEDEHGFHYGEPDPWSTHRDRQHRDRIKQRHNTLNDLTNGESFGGVEKIVHEGVSK